MQNQITTKYLAVYDRAKEDPVYLSLLAELRAVDPRLLDALEEMASEHRDTVMDYLGAVHAINARILELSLSFSENS